MQIPVIAATDRGADADSFWTPAGVESVAHLLAALLWPLIIVGLVFQFRRQIADALSKTKSLKLPFGLELTVQRELQAAAGDVGSLAGKSDGPTESEIKRAEAVEALTDKADISFVKKQADDLALEYERIRAAMAPGDSRTREMEKVVAKMRVVGRAAFPLRHELARSVSPGKRLQAIATLQVDPDEDYFLWLAERLKAERPFVGYHAAVALVTAANAPDAGRYLPELKRAAEYLRGVEVELSSDSDRQSLVRAFIERVNSMERPV